MLGTPVAVLVLGVTFGVWVDPSRIDDASAAASVVLVQVGEWQFTLAAYLVGLATSLRLAALLVLSLIAGLTSTGPEFVRAMVQNLRVPYRIGYTALAALRFVPRFGYELEVIRAAHRASETDTRRGPIVAAVARHRLPSIPLLASAIRHAERVAGHGRPRVRSAPTRTERIVSRWRVRDTVFVVAFWLVGIAIYAVASTGLRRPPERPHPFRDARRRPGDHVARPSPRSPPSLLGGGLGALGGCSVPSISTRNTSVCPPSSCAAGRCRTRTPAESSR